jgi:hypothetical protein
VTGKPAWPACGHSPPVAAILVALSLFRFFSRISLMAVGKQLTGGSFSKGAAHQKAGTTARIYGRKVRLGKFTTGFLFG